MQVCSLATTEAHEQTVHLIHHADVGLVEEDWVGTAGVDALRPCGSTHHLRCAWQLPWTSYVASSNTRGEVKVERNTEIAATVAAVSEVGLDWWLEGIS